MRSPCDSTRAFCLLDTLVLEEVGGQVALAGIAEHCGNHLARSKPACDPYRGTTVRAGRYPHQQSFFPSQASRPDRGFLVADRHDLVVDFLVQNLRNKTGTDALDLVKPWLSS